MSMTMAQTNAENSNRMDAEPQLDPLAIGRRIRHLRKQQSLTLDELAEAIGRAPSQLSMIETGKREAKLSQLQAIARALGVTLDAIFDAGPLDERAELELALQRAMGSSTFAQLGIEPFRIAKSMPTESVKAILTLASEIDRLKDERSATPEEARRANVELRRLMRSRDNYFEDLERAASELRASAGTKEGPITQRMASDIAAHLGFTLHYASDLPHSTRSIADLENGKLYLTRRTQAKGDARTAVLQALSSRVLGHQEPTSYAEFLRQRVETNYLTGAILLPETHVVDFLQDAKRRREISIEDLRDAYTVSYETAAHRFTNLATRHLEIPVHFLKVHESGTITKAYENDDVNFPTDRLGSIEGQMCCRKWTSRVVFDVEDRFNPYYQYTDTGNGTYWCTARVEAASDGLHSLSVGVRFDDTKWFVGRDTTNRGVSRHSVERCCRVAPAELEQRWRDKSWPNVSTPRTLLATLPTGAFPGVDTTDVYEFLESHSPALDS